MLVIFDDFIVLRRLSDLYRPDKAEKWKLQSASEETGGGDTPLPVPRETRPHNLFRPLHSCQPSNQNII